MFVIKEFVPYDISDFGFRIGCAELAFGSVADFGF